MKPLLEGYVLNWRLGQVFLLGLGLLGNVAGLPRAAAAIGPGCQAYLTQERLRSALDAFEDRDHADELADEIYAVAAEHLDAQGVSYQLRTNDEGQSFLWIKPDATNPSRLNQWAASLWAKHHVRFIYDVRSLAIRSAVASFVRPEAGRPGDIRLPSEALLDADHLSSSLAHEMLHSITIWHQRRGDPFPFYGRIWAEGLVRADSGLALEIPGTRLDVAPTEKAAAKKRRSYARYFAFDEINTHYGQSGLLLRRIRNGKATTDETPKLARSRMARGLRLSRQTARLVDGALAALEPVLSPARRARASDAPELEYLLQDKLVVARLRFAFEGVRLKIEMPLVSSSGTGDAANASLLAGQLGVLKTWSLGRQQSFKAMQEELAGLKR